MEFMTMNPTVTNYHSKANGWVRHEKYASSYAFVLGEIDVGEPADRLTAEELKGRDLYLQACISCHEQPDVGRDKTVWELRAVSYPRRHFDHRNSDVDHVSGASPYALHDKPAVPRTMTPAVETGMQLFQENCAFCHAADGTGRNWIGSFLEPRPRDFTAPDDELILDEDRLKAAIRNGLSGRSMPAWRDVLSEAEVDAIVAYMQAAFGR
jgi:cytochrome c oxidase cbb3-type subunit 3